MKPPPFKYHDPTTVRDAIGLLATLENVRLLAGGQSLVPMLNFRLATPDHLIDLNRVGALSSIDQTGERLQIGAMTRQQAILRSDVVLKRVPILAESLRHVGHRPTRNRGTIGGSLAHFDPAAELSAMAALLEAELTLEGPSGVRTLSFDAFAVSMMTTAMEADEILTRLSFPTWPEGHGFGFAEFSRRLGDFAVVSAGALLTCDSHGRIDRAALVIGAATPFPVRMRAAERALIGTVPDDRTLKAACASCSRIDALDDAAIPASYRRHIAPVIAHRALRQAFDRMTTPAIT